MKRWLFSLLFAASLAFAECPGFQAANERYTQGDYAGALAEYKLCLDSAGSSTDAALDYNLGNTYFRMDSLGMAILFYERAHRLAPADKDIAHNLKFARARAIDKTEEESNPILRILFEVHHALSLDAQLLVFIGFSWLLAALLAVFFLKRPQHAMRDVLFLCMFVLVFSGGVGLASAGQKIWTLERTSLGVVTGRTADVYSGPGPQYPVLNELNEGTAVEVLSVQGTESKWAQIRLGNIEGFVPLTQMGVVE
jgi:tetratricopeptide (TPR) repeat protein